MLNIDILQVCQAASCTREPHEGDQESGGTEEHEEHDQVRRHLALSPDLSKNGAVILCLA